MNEFLSSMISGVLGGAIVWFGQQWYSNSREKRKDDAALLVSSFQAQKMVDETVLDILKPGRNIDLMYEALGEPLEKRYDDSPVFNNQDDQSTSFLYIVKNAYIKITSKDNEIIDSITVFPTDTSFSLKGFPNPFELDMIILNKTKVSLFNPEDVNHEVIVARHDETFVIQQNVGNPYYMTFTYFGYFEGHNFMGNWRQYKVNQDPKTFIGGTFAGICVSSSNENAYYIYSYEGR